MAAPFWASLVAQTVRNLPATQETWVRSLGWEDPLEKRMATHSSLLAWRILWTEESGGLQVHRVAESDMTEWLSTHAQHHFTSPLCESSNFSISSPTLTWLLLFVIIIIATPVDLKWYLTVVLICISLLTTDAENLFTCLLFIYISSWEKCLFKFLCPFFKLGCLSFWCPNIGILHTF